MTNATILPPEADPIATLRTMAAFGMDEGRGIAEILEVKSPRIIGLALLCKNPEKTPIPIFDPATRAVEVTMLGDWLKARGYEASACRWNRKRIVPGGYWQPGKPEWELVTGPAEVPMMPPDATTPLDHETARRILSAQYAKDKLMPDDQRTQQIEKRIDRTIADNLAVTKAPGGVFVLAPQNMGEILEFAKMMAISSFCVRPAFRNNPGACLGVAMQAFRVGGDPFAWANKAYITKNKAGEEQIAYEAQLVHATINASPLLTRRLRHFYDGAGTARRCRIVGWVRGEDEPLEYESPPISQIAVKNSPLWNGDPDQQLAYYSTRAWARRHVPEILLGIFTVDEMHGEIIDMTPQHGAVQEAEAAEPIPWEVYSPEGEVYQFERSNSAVEACRKILIASAADPAKLATAWENNAGFILALGQEGLEPEAQAIERLYAELMPQPQPEIGHPAQGSDATAGVGAPAQGEASHPTPPADASESGGGEPPFAQTDTAPGNGDGSKEPMDAAPAPSQDGTGPTVTKPASPSEPPTRKPSADPFWQRPSLKIDPPPVRGGGSLSKLDWKSWPALLTPRIRQVWTIELLNRLYQDNADGLGTYESTCGSRERNDLDTLFDDARMELAS